jgi:hypothetical protein
MTSLVCRLWGIKVQGFLKHDVFFPVNSYVQCTERVSKRNFICILNKLLGDIIKNDPESMSAGG